MASSKSRNKKRKKRKQNYNREKHYKSLMKRLKESDLVGSKKVVIQPPGTVKMSEVFMEFVKPYMEYVQTNEEYHKLFTVALVAWNASLMSEEKQKEIIHELRPSFIQPLQDEFERIVNMMIERKKIYFTEYDKAILDYEFTDLGDDIHITVASTLD